MNEETHTIGALPRWFPLPGIRFEMAEAGAGGDGGGEAIAAEPAADDALGLEGAAAPAGAELSVDDLRGMISSGIGEAFQEALAREEHQAAQQRAAQQTQQTPDLPEWDPFNREAVMAHMASTFGPAFQQLSERFAPALETSQEFQAQRGEAEANTVLDALGDELENKDFDREQTIQSAAALMNREGLDPEEALRTAAQRQIEFETRIEQRGVEKFKQAAQNMGDQVVQPAGGNGAAAEVEVLPRGPEAYRIQARKTLANMGRGAGVGSPTG